MFQFDTLSIWFAIVCGLLAFVTVCLCYRRNEDHAKVRESVLKIGQIFSKIGLVKAPVLCTKFATVQPVKFMVLLLHELDSLIAGGEKAVLDEISGAISHMAATPDGLKLLQDAIAKATPATAPAPVKPAA